mmetsp:Transcript_34952/g.96626  ORF Transcript_34952/g.96626 Transcript_34952/m.96626 type:complete len:706 (+) Transcript_34952:78-2195(+)
MLRLLCLGAVGAIVAVDGLRTKAPHLYIDGNSFILSRNGEKLQVHAGEMHYFRVPEIYWEDRLQRLRAMGLNTVSTYVPWNWHEQQEGVFDWSSDRKDVSKFLRLAHEVGLYVILRAGPYICAEWEFGGLPAWLLRYTLKDGMRFRSSDKKYLSFVDRYWDELMPKVRKELLENGGSVAMVQLENELGALQDPKAPPDVLYMEHLQVSARKHLGPRVFLFSTDNSKGSVSVPGLFQAVNLGPWQKEPRKHLDEMFGAAQKLNGDAPEFAMELWTGWFEMWHKSSWDEDRFREPGQHLVDYVEDMLRRNASFTLYMAHGGTNFGAWNSGTIVMHGSLEPRSLLGQAGSGGASGLTPEVVHSTFVTTSYDYAAPISEEGRHYAGRDGVDKFVGIRRLLSQYRSPSDGPIPDEPPFQTLSDYGTLTLERRASLRDPNALEALCSGGWQTGPPQPMEMHGQQLGMVLYRFSPTEQSGSGTPFLLSADEPAATLSVKGKDRVTVWHGESLVSNLIMNVEHGNGGQAFHNVTTPPLEPGRAGVVDILTENLGRRAYICTQDFGYLPDLYNDWKGIAEEPLLDGERLTGQWSFCQLPLEDLAKLGGSAPQASSATVAPGPAFFEGTLVVKGEPAGDTFLRFDAGPWKTGSAYLNGFHLGRYWRDARGPFDLYVPKSVLRDGTNYVVVLEMDPSEVFGTALVHLSDVRGPTPI